MITTIDCIICLLIGTGVGGMFGIAAGLLLAGRERVFKPDNYPGGDDE